MNIMVLKKINVLECGKESREDFDFGLIKEREFEMENVKVGASFNQTDLIKLAMGFCGEEIHEGLEGCSFTFVGIIGHLKQ